MDAAVETTWPAFEIPRRFQQNQLYSLIQLRWRENVMETPLSRLFTAGNYACLTNNRGAYKWEVDDVCLKRAGQLSRPSVALDNCLLMCVDEKT